MAKVNLSEYVFCFLGIHVKFVDLKFNFFLECSVSVSFCSFHSVSL